MTNDDEQPRPVHEEPTAAASQPAQAAPAPTAPLAPADAGAALPVTAAGPPAPSERTRWRPSGRVFAGVAGVAAVFLLFGSGFVLGSEVGGGENDHRPRLMREDHDGMPAQGQPMRRDGQMPGQRGNQPQQQDRDSGR